MEFDLDFRDTMQVFMDDKQSTKSFMVGPSSAGKCYRQSAYKYLGVEEDTYRVKDKANLGTLLHLGWSAMISSMFDPATRQADVPVQVPGLPRMGEADDVDWKALIVTDLKSANDRAFQRFIDNEGPYENYWDQAEMYAYGLNEVEPGDWTLRIVVINTEKGGTVEFTRPANLARGKALADELAERHEALMAALERANDPTSSVPVEVLAEQFPREGNGPERGFPCDWCEWVGTCWPDAEDGLSPQSATIVDDPEEVARHAEVYKKAAAAEAEAKRVKYDAQAFLRGITGTFGEWSITQTKDGEPTPEPDTDAMVDLLSSLGYPIPTLMKPGRRGYPKVSRRRVT